jgi:hypothetical protein
MRGWEELDFITLVAWMEDNRELLRSSSSTKLWTKKAKEAAFANNEDISVKKIKSKYHNMKTAWQAAKRLQEHSSFGVREDECTSSANGRNCQFFANCEAPANLAFFLRGPQQEMPVLLEA